MYDERSDEEPAGEKKIRKNKTKKNKGRRDAPRGAQYRAYRRGDGRADGERPRVLEQRQTSLDKEVSKQAENEKRMTYLSWPAGPRHWTCQSQRPSFFPCPCFP